MNKLNIEVIVNHYFLDTEKIENLKCDYLRKLICDSYERIEKSLTNPLNNGFINIITLRTLIENGFLIDKRIKKIKDILNND